jgi:hypothetical protein
MKKTRITPLPQVYRKAAEFIASKEETYSCLAISRAIDHVYFKSNHGRRDSLNRIYKLQYQAMFGPTQYATCALDILGEVNEEAGDNIFFSEGYKSHPFWDYDREATSEKVREARINALLLMAAIVENPVG